MAFVQKSLQQEGGFGANLRELRELRGLTRQALSELTQIHVSIIQALEEEDLAEFKDPEYAERHVRALVTILEGRPGYFLKKYKELLKKYSLERTDRVLVRPRVRRRDFFVSSRIIAVISFFVVAFFAIIYLSWQAFILQEPPPLTLVSPDENAVLHEPYVDIRGSTLPNVTVTVNGRRAVVERDGSFTMRFDLSRGPTTLSIEAKRRYGSSEIIVRQVTYERESIE
ncbi:MAG: helix-turn-helix domain-containing protein [bacterium]|nr:helix-turn-helix domain-containing protein [bacterium]